MVTRLGVSASWSWLSVSCHYSVYTINCSSGFETSTCTSWGWNVNVVIVTLNLIIAHLTENANPGVEAVVVGVQGMAAVWTGDAAPPRLLLRVSQYVRLQVGGLCELLVTTLQSKQLILFYEIRKSRQSLPQMDTHKAGLQCVFSRAFSDWSLRRIFCHNPRRCTEIDQR